MPEGIKHPLRERTKVLLSSSFFIGNQLLHIEINIWCETVGQKAALIGVGGERLKKIGSAARRQIENVLDCRVHLAQRVKVKRGWVDDRKSVVDLGYGV